MQCFFCAFFNLINKAIGTHISLSNNNKQEEKNTTDSEHQQTWIP